VSETDPEAFAGSWTLQMKTPIGTIDTRYRFEHVDGLWSGTATGAGEDVALTDVAVAPARGGLRVTWRQSIRRPLRLDLEFDVHIDGDTLTGESRAGRLPRTRVTGARVAP